MTEIEKLHKRLVEAGTTNFNIFPGTNPNVTAEERAKEINRIMDLLDAGELKPVERLDSDIPQVELKDFLSE